MCGISGIVSLPNGGAVDERRFAAALETIVHRGPDAGAIMRCSDDVLFGHRRLSIIDLSNDSNQPFVYAGRYTLVYNGEIYNYLELREELEALGVVFRTKGDVEVVIAAYARWGAACVHRFNGMWAFAIHDRADGSLFCSRDRFGVKPFHYGERDGRFHFASEIKAILAYEPGFAEPDYTVIANYVRTSVGAQHAETWFRGIRRLPPGCNLTLRDGKLAIERYWDYPADTPKAPPFAEAAAEFSRLFRDAVRIRMRSDVPLGLTLSSGLDSTAIAYAMQANDPSPHYCFTSRFHAADKLVQDRAVYREGGLAIDESVIAREVAVELGLRSVVVETDYDEFVERLTRIVHHLESGNSSPAVVPLMQLFGAARKQLTVVLEGQGADELLGGYILSLFWPSLFDQLRAGRVGEAWAGLREFARTYSLRYSVLMALRSLSNALPWIAALNEQRSGLRGALGPRLAGRPRMPDYPAFANRAGGSAVNRTLRRQHAGGLVNLLHYGDAISMANSLESRMPFLDYRLVEFAWKLPSDYKLKLGVGKRLQREALRGWVPDRIVDNRTKHGFSTPIGEQFRKEFAGAGPVEVLLSERCLSRGMFAEAGLRRLIAAHRTGRRDQGPVLFRMLSTELWFRTFID